MNTSAIKTSLAGNKLAPSTVKVIRLCTREGGATADQIKTAAQWVAVAPVRFNLNRIGKQVGMVVDVARADADAEGVKGKTIYRLLPAPAPKAKKAAKAVAAADVQAAPVIAIKAAKAKKSAIVHRPPSARAKAARLEKAARKAA